MSEPYLMEWYPEYGGYDQQADTIEFGFYLGENVHPDGMHSERRSDYMTFVLRA